MIPIDFITNSWTSVAQTSGVCWNMFELSVVRHAEVWYFLEIFLCFEYSKTCIQRSPLGQKNYCIRQLTSSDL